MVLAGRTGLVVTAQSALSAPTRQMPQPFPQLRCAALLFDVDGVLIDSTPAVARGWRAWAIDHAFDPDEVVSRAHGRPSLATVREYLPHADHDAENREVERREIEDLEGIIPLPGSISSPIFPTTAGPS
jgi:hypothetical protein